jgi:zinc transporter, ZIP family
VWDVGKLVARDSAALGKPFINWLTLGGLVTGIAIMYFTAFLVKF